MNEMDEMAKRQYNEALRRVRAGEHVGKDELNRLGKMAGYDDSRVDSDLASARSADFSDLSYE
jgi:hypothetical protein